MATFYVSATTANGISAGNDLTGDGSLQRPWATIAKANAMAANGDTVMLNDGVYSPAKTLEISNGVSWQGVRDYGATIRGIAGQSRVIGISEDQAGTVRFGKINIDGANTTTSLITLNTQASTYGIQLNGTRLLNPTSYGIQGTSGGTRANVALADVQFTGSRALSMLNIASLTAGNVSIQGGTVNIANVWRSGFGGIATVNADAGNLPVTIAGVKATLHATGTSATTYGAGIYYGIRLTDVARPLIERNEITQTGTSADQNGYTVLATYDKVNPFDISGGIIRYNTLRNTLTGSAGKIILVGADADPGASVRNKANGFQIYGNSGSGDQNAETAKLHGILVGWQNGAEVYDNSMDYTSLAYVLKGMSGRTVVYDNTDTRTSSKSLYQKGGTGVQFLYNTSYQTGSLSPDIIVIGDSSSSLYAASGGTAIGNTLVYTGEPDSFVTVSPGSSLATISGNAYYSATGNSSSAWLYQGNSYKTLDAWKSAVEANATSSVAATIGKGAILGAISVSGQGLQTIGMVNGVQTYAVNFTLGAASSTSFAIGNFGAAGAASISGLVDADMSGAGGTSLSGSGVVDRSYGPLGSGARLNLSVSYDGRSALSGQVLHISGNYTNTRPIDIIFRTGSSAPAVAPTLLAADQTLAEPAALQSFVSPSHASAGSAAPIGTGGALVAPSGFADATPAWVENTAPLLAGSRSSSVADTKTVKPFSTMTISDPDKGASERVTVTLDDPAKGEFSRLNGFTVVAEGVYTFSGGRAEAQTALRSMIFNPADGRIAQGQSEFAQFTVSVSDGMATTFDDRTKVLVSGTSPMDQPLFAFSPTM